MNKWFVFMHSTVTVTNKEVKMKSYILTLFFFGFAFSMASSQKSLETDNTPETAPQIKRKPDENSIKNIQNSPEKLEGREPFKSEFLIIPDDKLIINPRQQISFDESSNEQNGIPVRLSDSGIQGFLVAGNNGRYNVQIQSLHSPKPFSFNTALGTVSSHILGQRTNQEYIPFPPNGDPYNYPAYRGYPHATEPPVVRAYETASNANYGIQPSADINQYNPRRVFSNNGYHQGFFNQFDNFELSFYSHPYLFNNNGFYSGLRRNDESIYENNYNRNPRENFNRLNKGLVSPESLK